MLRIIKLLELFIILSASLSNANRCGKEYGPCKYNACCSQFGWCGFTSFHCDNNCQPEYGRCNNVSINIPNTGKNIVSPVSPTSPESQVSSKSPVSSPSPASSKSNTSSSKSNTSSSKSNASSKSPVSSASSTTNNEDSCKDSKLSKSIIAYYPEWKYYNFPPSDIPFNKLTHVNYAFAEIDPNNFSLKYDSAKFLELINTAHKKNKNVKIIMSIGGWLGSRYYSYMTSNASNRSKFINSVKSMLETSGADGIDIDWEYPGLLGAYYDSFDAQNDTYNLLKLLEELRESIGYSKIISAAVPHNLFTVNNQPLQDLSKFAELFDYINIMAYDFSGSWSSIISHQSSLYPAEDETRFSFSGAVKNWMGAKFPAHKIVVGIPAYGRSWISVTTTNNGFLQAPSDSFPKGDEEDVIDPELRKYSSIWKYKNLRKQILQSSPKDAIGDWNRIWDSKSSVPYLFNKNTRQFITYDDPESVSIKADYVINNKLGGMMMWEIEEDTKDSELISTIFKKFSGLTCKNSVNKDAGNKNIVDSGLNLDLDKVPSNLNNNSDSNSKENKNACPNSSSYKCCNSCNVVYEDSNKWGVLNREWCSITYECLNKIKQCWSEAYGYPCCSKCVPVVEISNNKEWGIENGNWCGMPSNC